MNKGTNIMVFERWKKTARSLFPMGNSLWFELPGVTNDQVRVHFKTGLVGQDKVKYSKSIVIRSLATGNFYTLYKCRGQWRVGASDRSDIDRMSLMHLFSISDVLI